MKKIIDHIINNIKLENFDSGDSCFKIPIPIDIDPVIKKRFEVEEESFNLSEPIYVFDVFERFDKFIETLKGKLLKNQDILEKIKCIFMYSNKVEVLRIEISDYNMDINVTTKIIDIDNLDERLVQNRAQEILSNLWLDYLTQHQKFVPN